MEQYVCIETIENRYGSRYGDVILVVETKEEIYGQWFGKWILCNYMIINDCSFVAPEHLDMFYQAIDDNGNILL